MAVLSEEVILELAERLQEKFLQDNGTNHEVDHRDVSRIRSDVHYVSKFIRHHKGKFDSAYKQMVECHKWRKSIGLNDIRYDDIDEGLWRSGLAWNQGYDVDGNNVVILNLRVHKKDSKMPLMVQKWISFCFNMHCLMFPKNKMCLVFDATGTGLSNMDMALIRFVVNCFKTYFPDLLSCLLIYNMSWVLQAGWKVVQGWFSESAIDKVRFVSKKTFQEFIPKDQLLVKFGGSNTWEFNYEAEKALMLSYMHKVFGEERGSKNKNCQSLNQENGHTTTYRRPIPCTMSAPNQQREVVACSCDLKWLNFKSFGHFLLWCVYLCVYLMCWPCALFCYFINH